MHAVAAVGSRHEEVGQAPFLHKPFQDVSLAKQCRHMDWQQPYRTQQNENNGNDRGVGSVLVVDGTHSESF